MDNVSFLKKIIIDITLYTYPILPPNLLSAIIIDSKLETKTPVVKML